MSTNKRPLSEPGLVARRITARMEEMNLSILGLAIKLGKTYEHVRKTVRGESLPGPAFSRALCTALEIDHDEMLKLVYDEGFRRRFGTLPKARGHAVSASGAGD